MSMIGKSLIHYEISAELGKGGMGEVYQAKDTKLGRDVAIKVLPEEFALDKDRVARFQREAKLLASLNHPNIAAIHGLEESDGIHFLVLELIEGDTLSDRIKSGSIPAEEALKLALQMTEALEAAHEKGVIHRDLKPTNIKITPDGKVKVLDFGLAKAYVGDQENMSPMDSPTISAAATQQGIILGTAAYMSPEQARGETVDRKADIWAFGVVLFEMLTGRQVFTGRTVSDTLASVLAREPEWNCLPPNLHSRIRFLLERCLKKEAKDRYSGISDARVDVKEVLDDPSGVFAQPSLITKPRKQLQLGLPWIAVIFILGLIIAGVTVWVSKPTPPSEPRQVHRFYHDLPEGDEFGAVYYGKYLAVSDDGTKIVYVANDQLYLKNSNELTARSIRGTNEFPADPFFSPDGQWIGYFSILDDRLKKISIMGGTSVALCEINGTAGAIWGSDDMIVFGQQGSIMRVSANGGTPEEIIKEENEWLNYPQILPDGKSILFTNQEEGGLQVVVQSLESKERKNLFPGGIFAQYVSTGHLVYGSENNLTAIRFDPDKLETIGGPVPLVEGVYRRGANVVTQSAISESGTLVYIPGGMGVADKRTLMWVDREGKEEPLNLEPGSYDDFKISPDGTKVALIIGGQENVDIWICDLARKTMTRFTFDEAIDENPIWTPDGSRIIFCSTREGRYSLYWKASDGSGKVEQLLSIPDRRIYPWSISKDGKTLLFIVIGSEGGWNIGMISMEGDRESRLLLQEEFTEIYPQISLDGRWMVYQTNESGQNEVYVRQIPDVDSSGRYQVSTNGGEYPLWSPDGHEVYYRNRDSFMAVSVETDPVLKLGTPEVIFKGQYVTGDWDVNPDGKRFLTLKWAEATTEESGADRSRKIIIVQNWFEELKQRVPVD